MPLAGQERSRWDAGLVAEGVGLIRRTPPEGRVGPYQLQAAVAAVHDEAESAGAIDWPQILALDELLERTGPNPMVALNRAVALAMVEGPAAGLALLDEVARDERLARRHRLLAARAHLLELLGERAAAAGAYREAARRTTRARAAPPRGTRAAAGLSRASGRNRGRGGRGPRGRSEHART